MAQRKSTTGQMIDRFRYAPGDGYVYVWQAGRDVITVNRIIDHGDVTRPRVAYQPTGDIIPTPPVATATAMSDAVAMWRAGRVTGEGS